MPVLWGCVTIAESWDCDETGKETKYKWGTLIKYAVVLEVLLQAGSRGGHEDSRGMMILV